MIPKTLAVLLVATFALVPTAGAALSPNACDAAILGVQAHLRAEGAQGGGTLDALAAAIRACPQGRAAAVPNLPVGTVIVNTPGGVPSEDCSFSDGARASVADAPIGGFIQVGAEATPVTDHGPADALYLFGPEQALYEANGATFGFRASNTGAGTMIVEGVVFAATDSWAQVGCAYSGSQDLCWGQGFAEMTLVGGLQVLTFELNGAFDEC